MDTTYGPSCGVVRSPTVALVGFNETAHTNTQSRCIALLPILFSPFPLFHLILTGKKLLSNLSCNATPTPTPTPTSKSSLQIKITSPRYVDSGACLLLLMLLLMVPPRGTSHCSHFILYFFPSINGSFVGALFLFWPLLSSIFQFPVQTAPSPFPVRFQPASLQSQSWEGGWWVAPKSKSNGARAIKVGRAWKAPLSQLSNCYPTSRFDWLRPKRKKKCPTITHLICGFWAARPK